MKPKIRQLHSFLKESNAIEGVYSRGAFEDAKKAWDFAYRERKKINSNDYILRIHKLLMRRLNREIAGKFRKCAVWIGGEMKPEEKDIGRKVLLWLHKTYVEDFDKKKKLSLYDRDDLTRAAHIEFEDIHPFEDGNGRTGRILYNIHRTNLALPLHIIHEGEEQQQYYEWFRHEKDVKWIIDHYKDFEL